MATPHDDPIRRLLTQGPATARRLADGLGISQPTVSRAIASLGDEVLRLGTARSIHYALRDGRRGLPDMPVYRVDEAGRVAPLGMLAPVRPDGFVMRRADGVSLHSEGLPWWLYDMRPQGFLGRAYAARHAAALGLPARLSEWSDAQALRALLAHGHDAVGNLLLGDLARDAFLDGPPPRPIAQADKPATFAALAREATRGEHPASSAGGEQPKFAACVAGAHGPAHVLVKFSLPERNPVTGRWRDLLLAEHLALQTLAGAGIAAARSQWIDHDGQRFLEVERFDRIGPLGRRAVCSLAALDAEFVGRAGTPWPVGVGDLAAQGRVAHDAVEGAALLHAFGTLIGNTDMHGGNLSFIAEPGRPCTLAPAYDMLPMGFAPQAGGGLPAHLPAAELRACVPNAVWRRALALAGDYLARVRAEPHFSPAFAGCIEALGRHVEDAASRIERLG